MKDKLLDLPYFKAPFSHTLIYPGASPDSNICACCKQECEHTYYFDETRGLLGTKEYYGCIDCLIERKFSVTQSTEIGEIENGKPELRPPDGFSEQAMIDIGYSPPVATYQNTCYLTHCNDFMTYIGRWNFADFEKNAPDGDGRALWMSAVIDKNHERLWDSTVEEMEEYGDEWPQYESSDWAHGAGVYMFKCRHCDKIRCYWDCD